MSWTKVSDTHKNTLDSGTSAIAVFNISATSVGNVLVVTFANGVTESSVALSGGGVGVWIQAITSGSGLLPAIWYGVVTSGTSNTAITVTTNNGSPYPLNMTEFSWSGGAATSVTVEAGTVGSNTHTAIGTAINSGTIMPTAGRDAFIVCSWTRNGGVTTKTSGPTNSFTELAGATGNATSAYLLVSSTTGSYSVAWVYSNNYATHNAVIACLSIASGGPATKPGFFRLF
jgi:hypothetical protein